METENLTKTKDETDVKVVAKFGENTKCEFLISVKSKHGGLYDMLKMFASYFASLEYYKDKNPGIDKHRKKVLEPIALAIAEEIGRHDLEGGAKSGVDMFEKWVKSSFQSLKSGHGV